MDFHILKKNGQMSLSITPKNLNKTVNNVNRSQLVKNKRKLTTNHHNTSNKVKKKT